MSTINELRAGTHADLPSVLAENQREKVWTSDLDLAKLKQIVQHTTHFLVVPAEQGVAAFVLAMASTSSYPNENFNWFKARYDHFLYVDRIVVSKQHAGRGLGKVLYNNCFAHAAENDLQRVVCEYSTVPMNEGSAAFHAAMGFVEVGSRTLSANKSMSMQSCELAHG